MITTTPGRPDDEAGDHPAGAARRPRRAPPTAPRGRRAADRLLRRDGPPGPRAASRGGLPRLALRLAPLVVRRPGRAARPHGARVGAPRARRHVALERHRRGTARPRPTRSCCASSTRCVARGLPYCLGFPFAADVVRAPRPLGPATPPVSTSRTSALCSACAAPRTTRPARRRSRRRARAGGRTPPPRALAAAAVAPAADDVAARRRAARRRRARARPGARPRARRLGQDQDARQPRRRAGARAASTRAASCCSPSTARRPSSSRSASPRRASPRRGASAASAGCGPPPCTAPRSTPSATATSARSSPRASPSTRAAPRSAP